MVKLTDIIMDDKTISCTLFPESSVEPGYIKVDISTQEVLEKSLPLGYEYCTSHLNYARRSLIKMAHSGEIPKKKTIMWY